MDSTLFEHLGRALAPEQVTQRLREAIASGVLKPGDRLNQADLADRLGVSRMPIREALRRLEAEGLVTLQPYKGAIVSLVSADELREIYEMRVALETLAVRRALPAMSRDDFDTMDALLRRMDDVTDPGDWRADNAAFHDHLYGRAGRPLLLDTIDNLRTKSDRFLALFVAQRDRTVHAQQEHWAILHACRQGEVDTVCRLLARHLQSTVTSLSATLETASATAESTKE